MYNSATAAVSYVHTYVLIAIHTLMVQLNLSIKSTCVYSTLYPIKITLEGITFIRRYTYAPDSVNSKNKQEIGFEVHWISSKCRENFVFLASSVWKVLMFS